MTKLTAEMKHIIAKAKVPVLATATKDGKPNAVPITFTKVISDDEILMMDVFMRKTRQNIEINPIVAVSAWFEDTGYQFKGKARIELSGKIFDEGVEWVKSKSPNLSPKAAMVIKVDAIYVTTGGTDAGKMLT